jgi:hypothetical protein
LSALPENSVIRRFFAAQPQSRERRPDAPTTGEHRPEAPTGWQRPRSRPVIGSHRPQQPTVVDADASPADRPLSTQLSSREWAELVEIVTRRIEARVTAELERRGRRNMPRPM